MDNFFGSSGADDQRPDSSHLNDGDDIFSFKDAPLLKNDDSGGSFFGESSSSGGGGDHESFFKPSTASKNEGSFFDFGSTFSNPEGGSTEAEPTFLAPFSRTPPRKRQNQGPPPTPSSQPTSLQHSADITKMECSSISSSHLIKGGADSSIAAPSSNRPNPSEVFASRVQQNSDRRINDAQGKALNEVNSQQLFRTQQHGPSSGANGQVSPMEELQESSRSSDEHHQQSKEVSYALMLEPKCGVGEVGTKVVKEEKGDIAMPLGRTGRSTGEFKSGSHPMGRELTGAHVPGGHMVGGGQDLLQQLLVMQKQHLAEMLTPELEKTMKKEEKMVKDLEQAEQKGKAYTLHLEGMKEHFGGRLGQISGFLGLNTKK